MTFDRQVNPAKADDVAQRAGVSRWTVHRAFKKDASISKKSRAKVMEAAEALGYAPDLLAVSLATDKSNLVALMVDDFANHHKLVMIEVLTRTLRRTGWDTLLVNTEGGQNASEALLQASQRRVDAAVLIGSRFNDHGLATALGARRVRKLIVFARYSANPDTISICCDDETAMAAVADHVIAKGYRKPLFLAGPQTQSAHLKRKETFLRRWKAHSGEARPFLATDAYDPQLAFRELSTHLSGIARRFWPDIVVCENDALAMGAMDALRHNFGLKIPEDIAVTGFDDIPLAANPNYALTSYRQPLVPMAEALVEVLKGEPQTRALHQFTGVLVSRGST